MAGSLSTAVRRAVITGFSDYLAGLPTFNTAENQVVVEYAYTTSHQAAQRVFTGRSRADTPPAALRAGRNHRNETGTFEIRVSVEVAAGSAEDADVRVDAICDELEAWLADRKSDQLGVGLTSLYVTSWIGDYFGVDGGAGAMRTYTVTWNARLT